MLRLILLLVCLGFPSYAVATTYYVTTTGNDTTGTGAIGNPWRNPQRCVSNAGTPVMVAGDTCLVGDGSFTDTDNNGIVVLIHSNPSSPGYANSGTAGSPITIKSLNYRGAVITIPSQYAAANSGTALAFRVWRPYWVIEGFEMQGDGATTQGASYGTGAIQFRSGSNGSVFRKNYVHDIARTVCSNSTVGNAAVGAEENPSGIVVEDNLFHTIGRKLDGEGGCSTNLYQNDHGFYLRGATNFTIRRNIIYDTTRGFPLHFYGTTMTDLHVYNNVVSGKPTQSGNKAAGQVMLASTITTADFRNNIFYNPPTGADGSVFTHFSLTATNVTIQYNLTDSTDTNLYNGTLPSGVTQANNLANTSPGFVNAGSNDYTLATGSAAINAGLSSVCAAYNGSACDIGVYEPPVFSSCVVEDGDASKIRVTFTNNVNPPLLPAASPGTFTSRKATVNNPVTASTVTGDNRVDLTVTAIVAAEAVDISWASGNLTDSAKIGGTLNQGYKAVLTNQACTNNVGAAASHVFTQAAFEFHGLRGTEAAPVGTPYASAPENTNILVRVGGSVRLRVAVTCTIADCPPTGFYPYYRKNGGVATLIPDVFSTDNIAMCGIGPDPDIPTNGTATTEQLSTAGTFVAGALVRTSNAIPTVDIALNGKTELEYCLVYDTDATALDTYDVELNQQDGTDLVYTVTPRMTITAPSAGMGF